MEKKGFTLIELLAVITIIGIVALITVPSIVTLIKGTEQDIFKTNEKSLADSAESYFSVNLDLLPTDLVTVVPVTLDVLVSGGYSKEIRSPIEDEGLCNGYVEVRQTKENVYEYTPYLNCGGKYITPGYSQ
ncbi:MAG: type II secretion system protein [Bacilli bacterium]|nr:type II secretion system protein [Bacilli bacterium]